MAAMFAEIRALSDNLDNAKARGSAVGAAKAKVLALVDQARWEDAVAFFRDYGTAFADSPSVLNIVVSEFSALVDALLALGTDFDATMNLHHLESMYWFDGLTDSHGKRGVVAEQMANFGQGIVGIRKLQEARTHYRRAQRTEDARRVQERLSGGVRALKLVPPALPPERHPALVALNESIAQFLAAWNAADSAKKFNMLIADSAGIRPKPYTADQAPHGDFFLSGAAEQLGIVQTVSVSPTDGRVDTGNIAPTGERIVYGSWHTIAYSLLRAFCEPVLQWLKSSEDAHHIYAMVGSSLKQDLDWDDDTTQHFMQALTSWMSGYPEVALAHWLPYFENALRMQLAALGEDVINPQPRTGIEDFVAFDSLLRKASDHYDDETVEYWRKVFSTSNGLGWNLRNSFCHGLLPIGVMKNGAYALAVFLAFLFLCDAKVRHLGGAT